LNATLKIQTLAVALVALGTSFSAAAGAQTHPSDPIVGPTKGSNTLACCHCLGEKTTLNLNTGAANWYVTSPDGGGGQSDPGNPTQTERKRNQRTASSSQLNSIAVLGVPVAQPNPAWTQTLSPALWIAPPGAPQAIGTYVYTTTFNVPACTIPSTVSLAGKFAADNAAQLYIDNNATPFVLNGPANYGFQTGSIASFQASPLSPGTHTIKVLVTNIGGPTGLVVQAAVTRNCTNNPYPGHTPPPWDQNNNPEGKHKIK
jgi:hypothetical protein